VPGGPWISVSARPVPRFKAAAAAAAAALLPPAALV
jgi:hypothetical protein